VFLGLLALGARADGPALVDLRVFPPEIQLATSGDRQSFVVQARYSDETTRDVTAETEVQVAQPALLRREGNVFHPAQDGETKVTFTHAGRSVEIPAQVREAGARREVSFKLDVMPVFMRANCNTGSCHGSARGQDGFMLSLFGYDPDGDYHRITREFNGRRINLARPSESLLVQKSIGTVPHTGGELFTPQSEYYATLVRWLEIGAPADDPAKIPTATGLELMPDRIVLAGEGSTHQLTARLRYSDGTDRDVTSLAVFITNNETSALVSPNGLITAGTRGEAFVMARYDTFTVGAQVIVVPKDEVYEFPGDVVAKNYVDEHVHAKLKKLRIVPSPVADDETFIRRATLDITGAMPTPAEVRAFRADPASDKWEKLVDQLLARKEFVEMWVMKWSELLQIRSGDNRLSYKNAVVYFNWLRDRIGKNTPISEIVAEILTASGGTFQNPATNYYQGERDTLKIAENVAQVFMGLRLQCAQCHNHPFDKWTMDDYYSFSAFFARVGRKNGEDPRETIVFTKGDGEVKHLVGGRNMKPRFPDGQTPEKVDENDRRKVFAEWLTAPENPYFARNIANQIWEHFFGKGIIDPVDDVRISNPAVNPDLLDALAAKLVEYNYDFKKLVRDITTSRTYQLSTAVNPTNAADTRNFARGPIRRIRAEVLLDSIAQVTETRNKFRGLPEGARATQIADGATSTYFLTAFGRSTRTTVCSCEVTMEPNLSQALHLLNGDTVNAKIKQGGVVKKLLDQKLPPEEVLDHLYLTCFARSPTESERQDLLADHDAAENKQRYFEDVFWALLNSKEFMFNH
jgi:hypothetical protein